jgi:hypothetical protein
MWPGNIPQTASTVPECFVYVGWSLALPSHSATLEQRETRLMNIFLTTQQRLTAAEMGGVAGS